MTESHNDEIKQHLRDECDLQAKITQKPHFSACGSHSSTKFYPTRQDPSIEVSDTGLCRRGPTGQPFPGRINSKGYRVVSLATRKTVGVHRLVAEAFLPPPTEAPGPLVVTHRDGNRLNNHVSNLEWISPRERLHRSLSHGRVLTPDLVRAIRRLDQENRLLPKEIARILRLPNYLVTRVLTGINWRHIT